MKGKESTKDWHKKLFVFGIEKDSNDEEIKEIISHLINLEFIKKSEGKYPTLSLTFKGRKFLDNPEKIELQKIKVEPQEILKEIKEDLDYDKELYEKLRILRKQIASEKSVPPFVIFGDVSLREMSHYLPENKFSFSKIKGVGEMKLRDFGDKFLELIKNHIQCNNS